MTYREMGLLEQAVDSFRVSEQDPRLTARSLEMIGRCFDDQGRYAEGALEFRRAIDAPGVSADMLDELHLQLATSLARSGDAAGAESELARIGADFETDPDLAERVAELRRSLGPS
jgi:lipopolysaccharide biosynthesis regulator YciM